MADPSASCVISTGCLARQCERGATFTTMNHLNQLTPVLASSSGGMEYAPSRSQIECEREAATTEGVLYGRD